MEGNTEQIIYQIVRKIAEADEVQSIGISGSMTRFPKAGDGDIDIFIYCSTIPDKEKRNKILQRYDYQIETMKINVFESGHWGTGDFIRVNGLETWLMYFNQKETEAEAESFLKGELPDKLDNYFYPTGRLAMFTKMVVLFDKNHFLENIKNKVSDYPEQLAEKLIPYHLNVLDDTEDLERASSRKDVLFYHFALDLGIDHFLQALFAMNRTYFPSRKRTLDFIDQFIIKPEGCRQKLLEVLKLGGFPEGIQTSYSIWKNLVQELKTLYHMQYSQ